MKSLSARIFVSYVMLFFLLTGCMSPDPDHTPKPINAPCVKGLSGVATINDISITKDGLKAIVVYNRGYETRMLMADLPSATVIKKYYGSPSQRNGVQDDVEWIGDSATKFWGIDGQTLAEMDASLNRAHELPCVGCYRFAISNQGLFAATIYSGSISSTNWTVKVFDQIGGMTFYSRNVSGTVPMSFSPDSRYLTVYQNGQKFIDLTTGGVIDAPPNLMKYAWIDSSTVLIPDESQPVIWVYNIETKDKREYLRLSLREGQANPKIAGVSGNGAMQYLVIWASYGDLHVVDVDCLRKLPSQ